MFLISLNFFPFFTGQFHLMSGQFFCLDCDHTIVNMVINIVLCFIPNKLLYL